MENMTAKTVLEYLERYKKYVEDNNLDNDMGSITLQDVIDFCDAETEEQDED